MSDRRSAFRSIVLRMVSVSPGPPGLPPAPVTELAVELHAGMLQLLLLLVMLCWWTSVAFFESSNALSASWVSAVGWPPGAAPALVVQTAPGIAPIVAIVVVAVITVAATAPADVSDWGKSCRTAEFGRSALWNRPEECRLSVSDM
uniref:(northern house mosquito) hypothetical protein n=1 Tax=Culex pipiens TaxID=7175 RepID=A0A8D8DLJ3_CULPI